MAYCYETDSCDGFLVQDEVKSYDDCCNEGGKGWGLYGTDMCTPCLPVDARKDDQIEKDLDEPSCKCVQITRLLKVSIMFTLTDR